MRPVRCLFVVLAWLGSSAAWAQKGTPGQTGVVSLRWDASATLPPPVGSPTDAPGRRVPTFRGAYHGPTDAVGTYTLRLPGTATSAALREAAYEPLPEADARLLTAAETARLPATPTLTLRTGTEARRPVSFVLLQPARRNPQTGQAERLVSFRVAYETGAGVGADANLGAGPVTTPQAAARAHVTSSVLSVGDWFKLGVPRGGVYKLDGPALQKLGVNMSGLDPRRVQLYGNAAGLLPQANAAPRIDDLAENTLLFVGNNDAVLDAGEYFLFYARGPHVWRPSQPGRAARTGLPGYAGLLGEGGRWKHLTNHYCDTAYYFLTVGSRPGRRVLTPAPPAPAPTGALITRFLDRRFYEHDLTSLLRSGRRWVGESFKIGTSGAGSVSREFSFSTDGYAPLTDLTPGDTLRLTAVVVNTAAQSSTFSLTLNGTTLGAQTVQAIPRGSFTTVAQDDYRTYTVLTPAGLTDPKVTVAFTSFDPVGVGYLDYLELSIKRELRLNGAFLEFNSLNYNRGPNTTGTFVVGGLGTGAQVWDVTNPRRAVAQTLDAGGRFVAFTDSVREFVAVQPSATFDVPRLWGRLPNQNLHALNLDGKLDLVIVTYPPYRAQAERLAQHRRDYSRLNVAVVTTRQVFNEYSSGGQDATAIRDLMKQVYDRNPDPVARRNYLLLFGDASFDYKSSPYNDASQEPAWWKAERAPFATTANFDAANQNLVPTYQSRESFIPVSISYSGTRPNLEGENSYSSEDYYALLDDSEGEWTESTGGIFEATDIGVGRLPVRSPRGQPNDDTQARQMVDKLLDYDAPASFGKWRNRIQLTADDTDVEKDNGFAVESEQFYAPTLEAAEPAYNLRKNYLDMFPQISTAAGQRSPAAMAAISTTLEQGALLTGYTGHGGPSGLTDEQIVNPAMLLALRNEHRLTFFVTGTCDLSLYDNPEFTSAGEQVLTDNATGGAIGLFTTTRVVLATFNKDIVNNFYAQILLRDAAGRLPFLGLASGQAKNALPSGDLNNRNYTLLADPTTRLAYPSQRVVLDSINGRYLGGNASTSRDTLQALGAARLSGHVEARGVLSTGFNGTADITLFDKPVSVMTLGDAGSTPVPVRTQENVIYGGQATVRGGRFSVRFVVPKDIAYNVGLGKVSLYAQDPAGRTDAQGYQLALVGAASRKAVADTRPPRVRLFLSTNTQPADTSFVSGGPTGLSPLLIARLRDESGINTSSAGIGHDLTATLDRDPRQLVVVNDAYVADVDNFRAGTLRFQFSNLAPGPHVITLKAWDTHNNSAEASVEFVAAQSEQLALKHVLNYPNPFSNRTTFHFDQTAAGRDLDVLVQVFTVSGKLVKTLRASFPASPAHVPASPQDPALTWDGRDDFNDQLARGVYVYRVSVRSGEQVASQYEKLVLLN